ncbi:uncharacterized protein METZ01_LOCUS84777 [marine metagenome]|uniref:Uncharacterized protein n=1 Tax=marine metagenome TaxID=408172 RepID=A0A381UY84_9ZZZZ
MTKSLNSITSSSPPGDSSNLKPY